MDESAKHVMKLTLCCGEFSAQILDSFHNLACFDKTEEFSGIMCGILTIADRIGIKKMLYELTEKSKICYDRCPIHQKSDHVKNNLKTRNKRQFDLASTYDAIGQIMCKDVQEGSTELDEWHYLFEKPGVDGDEVDDDYPPAEREYLRYAVLLRRPGCCLRLAEQRG